MQLDTVSNKYTTRKYVCEHTFGELTAVCPVTRLPDFYRVNIRYEPNQKLIELKSLKLYFIAFRDKEILHEEITNQILDDFIKFVEPRWVYIEVRVKVRGGIYTIISRQWSEQGGDLIAKPLSK